MKRTLYGLAVAVCMAVAAPVQAGTDAIKIGVLTDMAGVTADITGKGSVEAARMAVEEFGGTVLGKKIEVIFADHLHKVDVGTTIARKWFDLDNVDAVVDVPNSGVALAIQSLAREKKKIVMYSGAGTTALTNEACSPYGFHWTYDTYGLSHGTASAVVKAGGSSWFILAADYAFGEQLAKDTIAVVQANGGKVLGIVRHPLNTSDFSSYLVQAQASGAKVIGIANAGNDTVNAIKQAQEFGLVDKDHSLAAMILMLQDVHSLGLKAAQGTYLTTASYWDIDDASRAWSKKFFERTNMMPSMIHAGVYGSVLHYLKAIKAAGSDDPDKVASAMREMPINDAFTHDAHIRADGHVMRAMYLARVKSPSQSKAPWDYFEIVRKIEPEEAVWPLSESTCALVKK